MWHSCTKYLNGHSDVVSGALCTNDDRLAERLHFNQKGSLSADFTYRLERGLCLYSQVKTCWRPLSEICCVWRLASGFIFPRVTSCSRRSSALAVRLLPLVARPKDATCANGAPHAQRVRRGRRSSQASTRSLCPLSRFV